MNNTNTIVLCAAMAAIIGCRYSDKSYAGPSVESAAPFQDGREALPDTPCAAPKNAELLDALVLVAGETEADATFNEAERKANPEGPRLCRNSLFIRWRAADGTDEWRLLLTTGTAWREADGMNEWCKDRSRDVHECFMVLKARMSNGGRTIWLVCNPHTYMYNVVCRFDLPTNTFRVLGDGDTAEEQPDGTILVRNKKTFLYDENGTSMGAAWYDEWIDPNGQVIRKTEPKQLYK